MSPRVAVVLALAILLLFSLLPGCRQATEEVAPSIEGGTLRLLGDDPPTLDPALSGDVTSARYIVEVFSGLVTLDRDLRVIPDIAELWDISEDGTGYTFHLRRGVKFHNGRELTAADLKFSLERAADPETGSKIAVSYLGDIVGFRDKLRGAAAEVRGVRVVGDYTLELTIDAPKAYFLAKLAHPVAFVVDRENVASGVGWTRQANGTGPFEVAGWERGKHLILERNPNYYRGTANLERVYFDLSGGRGMTWYEREDIDITGVGLASIERVLDPASPLHQELQIVPQLSLDYVGFDVTVPPFDDVKVRQAFAHAVDIEKLVKVVQKGLVLPATGILPPGMPGYEEKPATLPYDPEKALQFLAASRYDLSQFPIVISAPGGGGNVDVITTAIAAMWRDNLGVQVEVELWEWADYLEKLRSHQFQVFSGLGWVADYPDPENFLDLLFHSQSVENNFGYADPPVDLMLEEARLEQDTTKRYRSYRLIEEHILQEAPIIPLSFGQSYTLVKPYVKGYLQPQAVVPFLKDVFFERQQ